MPPYPAFSDARGRRRLRASSALVAAVPAAAGASAALLSGSVLCGACTLLAGAAVMLASRLRPPGLALLPFARLLAPVLAMVAAALLATLPALVAGLPAHAPAAAAGGLIGALLLVGWRRAATPQRARRILLLGTRSEARELELALREHGGGAYRTVAVVSELAWLERTLAESHADLVVYTDALPRDAVLETLARTMRSRRLAAVHHDELCELALGVVPLGALGPGWLAELLVPGRVRAGETGKRALDLALALLALAPVLAVIALAAPFILLDGEGGLLFRQQRVGRYGRRFTMLKLRTMRGSGADWSHAGDPRVTRVGALLRRTHLDELPQVINVLRGEMSMVGPRPEQPWISDWLERQLACFGHRHMVRPGITGWARVRSGYATSTADSAVKLANDLYYVRHRSLALDVAILLETLRMFVADRQFEVRAPARELALGEAADRLASIDAPRPAAEAG